MKQRIRRLAVILLSILLLLGFCSQALAIRPTADAHVHCENEDVPPQDVTVTYNPDGSETYEIELAAEPVVEAATSEPDTIVDQGTHFENAGDEIDLRIEKEYLEGHPLVTVGAEGMSVSFFPVVEQNGESTQPTVAAEQQPSDDSVLYEGLFEEGTDVKLYARQRGVKEDIILSAYAGNHVYPYRMTFDGVTPVQEGNAIRLYDDSMQAIGCIMEPYMTDAAGATSTDIHVDFVGFGNDEYELVYTPSDAWLSDPSRAYPVTIDPYIDYYLGASAGAPTTSIAATYVNASSPGSNYSGSGTLFAGGAYTTFVQPTIRSDILNYSANTLILAAYLKPSSVSNPTAANIYPVLSSWNAGSITAGSMPQLGNALPGGGTRWVPALYAWDIAPIVGSWFDAANTRPNYGLALGNPGGSTCSMSASYTISITIYRITESISPSATGYASGCDAGYVTVRWNFNALANYVEYYLIGVYNGREYEYFRSDLNANSWSTQGKRIWPTSAEIAAGRYKLHLDGTGAELPASPLQTYRNADPSSTSTAYRFIILPLSWSSVPVGFYEYQAANPGYAASATISGAGLHAYSYGPWQQHNASQHKRQVTCANSGCSYSTWEYASHSISSGTWASINGTQHSRTKTCSVCGYNTTETANHTVQYSAWTSDGAARHKRTKSCSACGYNATEYADHALTYGAWTSDNAARHKRTVSCSVCNYATTEYADHRFSYSDWTPVDETQHSRGKTCLDCDYSTTEYGTHHDDDGGGRCDDCGYEMSNKALVLHTVDAVSGAAVAHARFTVVDVATNTPVKLRLTDNIYYLDADGNVTYVETDSAGQAVIRELSRGNYKITETRTAAGYFPVPAQTVALQNGHSAQNPLVVTIHYTREIVLGMDSDRYDGAILAVGTATILTAGIAVACKRRKNTTE